MENKLTHLMCFGDSITRGENDNVHGGWADRLKTHLIDNYLKTKTDEICVFNMGIGGETTEGLIKRFKTELLARKLKKGKNMATIAFGANDIVINEESNEVPENKFFENLNFCIDFALKNDVEVYLLNILPVLENSPKPRKKEDIEKYNATLQSISAEKSIRLIDVHKEFIARLRDQNLFTFDGVHPNSLGHQIIYDKVREVLFPTQ